MFKVFNSSGAQGFRYSSIQAIRPICAIRDRGFSGKKYIFAQEAFDVVIEGFDGLCFTKAVSFSGIEVVLVRYPAPTQGGNYHF